MLLCNENNNDNVTLSSSGAGGLEIIQHTQSPLSEGGIIRLETLMELKFRNSSFSSCWFC